MVTILKIMKFMFFSLLIMVSSFAIAQNSTDKTIADVKSELISSMEKDGYLSKKMANEAAQKYITELDKNTISKPLSLQSVKIEQDKNEAKVNSNVKWIDYLSWINFFKVVGIIFFLIAFSGLIKKIILGLWIFIAAVPVIVYQTIFLIAGLVGIFYPNLYWASQYFYAALFCAFSNIIVIGWIIETHDILKKIIAKIFNLGIPPSCVASFYGMLYFGVLAYIYQSSIFGFFSAVCLSGIFSFSLYYMPGVLFLDFKEKMLPAVVLGHLIVLGFYTVIMKNYPEYTLYFNIGIQYYCTVALCVGLLVGASPFYKRESALGYAALFVILFFIASYGFYLYDMKVVASIIFAFFILFVLEWIGYMGYHSGAIIGSAIIGGSLYATALLLEKYGSMIVLTMNQ